MCVLLLRIYRHVFVLPACAVSVCVFVWFACASWQHWVSVKA